MEIGSRRIVHVNVTTNPALARVKQQIREATAEDRSPRFLVYDNDGIFGQCGRVALDHFIFLSADHVRCVVGEYVRYDNGARPSQAIHGIPDPYPELREPPPATGQLVTLPVLGGVLHDYRLAA